MGLKRRIGNLSAILLDDYIRRQQLTHQSELVKQRQIELAKQNEAHENLTADNRRKQETFMAALRDPELARRLKGAGQAEFGPLAPTHEQDMSSFMGDINKAKTPSEMPEIGTLLAQARAKTQGDISPLVTQHQMRREQLGAEMEPEKVEEFDPTTGATSAKFLPGDPRKLTGQVVQQTPTTDQAISITNKAESGTRKEKVATAGAESFARAQAQSEAEIRKLMDPRYIKAKIDESERQHTLALAQKGQLAAAEEAGKRNAAVRGLLPMYQQYRELAVEVMNSVAGANTSTTERFQNWLSKVPAIGEALATGAETLHGEIVEDLGNMGFIVKDKNIAEKLNRLNRLTDTLAQGMANAVIGNRGATTENDRRVAKNILIGSMTTAQTGKQLLEITDRMFTLIPIVAGEATGQSGFKSVEDILREVAARAKQEQGSGGQQQQQVQPGGQPSSAQGVLDRLRQRGGRR